MYKEPSLIFKLTPNIRFGFWITANGKSIGEVRAFEELKVQRNPNVANAFSILLTYKKLQN